jgi:hypothetical protein
MAVDQIRRLHERMPETLHPTRRRLGHALAGRSSRLRLANPDPMTGRPETGRRPFTRDHTMTDEHIGCLGAWFASSAPK